MTKLKVKEVAEILEVDKRRVWKMVNNGELPAVNLSSGTIRPNWRIESEDLDNFIKLRKNGN
jgi:excisionase family DNA binding protein